MKKRRGYFFIAFISAAITFGCLTAFVNPRYSGIQKGYRPHRVWHRDYYDRYNPYWNYPPPYAYPDSGYDNHNRQENNHQ